MRTTALLLSLLLCLPPPAVAQTAPGGDLPDIGTPASTTLLLFRS